MRLGKTISIVCASGLVIASMGFGSVYAWQQGSEHSLTLGALTVLFVVCLEGVKPFAVSGALDQFKQWSPVRGLALLALAFVAIAYSLTAELSLMAQVKSDLVAQRESAAQPVTLAKEDRARALAELQGLGSVRPVGEVEADLAKLKLNPRWRKSEGCQDVTRTATAEVCQEVRGLQAELARSQRAEVLQQQVQRLSATLAGAASSGLAVGASDPGATALVTYLGALGLEVKAETLARWLVLVPVLAMEIGSALALVLTGSQHVLGTPQRATDPLPRAKGESAPESKPGSSQAEPESPVAQESLSLAPRRQTHLTIRDRVSQQLIDYLQTLGGASLKSHRSIAQAIQADRNTVRRAIDQLVADGVVLAQPSKRGTMLTLLSST